VPVLALCVVRCASAYGALIAERGGRTGWVRRDPDEEARENASERMGKVQQLKHRQPK